MTNTPSEAELENAPTLIGWLFERPSDQKPWLYGWFVGHPEIADGDHGHTSTLIAIDPNEPPTWAKTESRVYRLGAWYPPAERELRYWAQKIRQRRQVAFEIAPGGGDDIEEMIAFLGKEKLFRERKLVRMVNAYREEKARLPSMSSR
ncbi:MULTISPECIES: DUF6634 family protein [unclassified Rhizobium]|uniref:DUF6634 family protein n=1 Tax=unclassified Rhizobium TaxID=2613769 RepID=UPI001ADBEA84|nr:MULTISPECIES: DUF6634 family protein [unclassified Rhizobium]MBO9126930.1 hypothetical protein [Rhizobium sp. 16-488-2b]MBO9177378.1 hypothetical protein [Rhizobium sp. 16-488-2a]